MVRRDVRDEVCPIVSTFHGHATAVKREPSPAYFRHEHLATPVAEQLVAGELYTDGPAHENSNTAALL